MQKEKKMPPTSIRLDPDVHDGIAALAKADERSISSYINRVLRQHIEQMEGQKGREKSKK
jgi:hypothetical protein